MDYLLILDYQNLDNPLFLKSFAEATQRLKPGKSILLHSDSEYTERLIQTGMMREDAVIRSLQDLNHRLVSFFADYGLACIGINGFQRGTVKRSENGELLINTRFLDTLPEGTIVVLSTLAQGWQTSYEAVALPELVNAVQEQVSPNQTCLFSVDSADEIIRNSAVDGNLTLKWSEIQTHPVKGKIPPAFLGWQTTLTLCKPLYNNTLSSYEPMAVLRP